MKKCIIILLMVLLIPTSIKAEEVISGATITTKEGIVTPYNDLKKALNEAKEEDVVNLADKYESTGVLDIKEGVTLIITNKSKLVINTLILNGNLNIIDGNVEANTYLGTGIIEVPKGYFNNKNDNYLPLKINEKVSVSLNFSYIDEDPKENNIIAYLGNNKIVADQIIKYMNLDKTLDNFKLKPLRVLDNVTNEYEYFAVLEKRIPVSITIIRNINFFTNIKDKEGKVLTESVIWTVDDKANFNNIKIKDGKITNPNKYMEPIIITATLAHDPSLYTTIKYIPEETNTITNIDYDATITNLATTWVDNINLNIDEINYNRKDIKEINKKLKDKTILIGYNIDLYDGETLIGDIYPKRITLKLPSEYKHRTKVMRKKGNEYILIDSDIIDDNIIFTTDNLGEIILVKEIKDKTEKIKKIIGIFISSIIIIVPTIYIAKKKF